MSQRLPFHTVESARAQTSCAALIRCMLMVACVTLVPYSVLAGPVDSEPAAADSGGQLHEITVSARRRVEPLQEVPVALSVVTGAKAAEHNLNDLQDISAEVPTVEFRTGASNKDRDIFIRGVGTITTSPGVEPSVSTVVDGVVLARPGQATLELLDVDHIEVLRGPQGTLFGKNASAGVINILTTQPTADFHGYVDGGFDNILLPSGYSLGIDTIAFAAGMGPALRSIKLLAAIRCGEFWPPQQARQLGTLDRMLEGRLSVNIISSDLPGESLASEPRYRRTLEYMTILRDLLQGNPVDFAGDFYRFKLDPPRILRGRSAPLFYFGGLSEAARETAAQGADVYLMWPDRMETVAGIISDMTARAARHGRALKFGYRVHVIVRETESEARAAARRMLSKLESTTGEVIRNKSLDSQSQGVMRQVELRDGADEEGYAEANLWTGIGRARSGCGAGIVGDPDQVLAKLHAYQGLGIDSFILSGYPHMQECDLFARHVLRYMKHAPLAR